MNIGCFKRVSAFSNVSVKLHLASFKTLSLPGVPSTSFSSESIIWSVMGPDCGGIFVLIGNAEEYVCET